MLPDNAQEFYERSLEHGVGPEACGFTLPESQQVRFKMAAELVKRVVVEERSHNDAFDVSVEDVGCGTGAFLQYMLESGLRVAQYHGVDAMPEMVNRTRERIITDRSAVGVDWRADVATAERLRKIESRSLRFDVSVALATFCIKEPGESMEASFRTFRRAVRRMVDRTKELVIVTGLSTWKTEIRPDEMVLDPGMVFSWARSRWPRVDLYHSYAPHDFMLAIWLREGEWWKAWREAHQ